MNNTILKVSVFLSRSTIHCLILGFLSLSLLLIGITKPFIGIHDFNSVDYGIYARNHVNYGILTTKAGMATNAVKIHAATPRFSYYTHHPTLFSLLLAFSYSLFGFSELSTRAVPIFFSIFSVFGIYLLSKSLGGKLVGFFSALVFILNPMFLYYGKLPAHEPMLLCFGVWLLYLYKKWIETGKTAYFRSLGIITALIGLTGWPGYFFIPVLTVHSYIQNRKRWKKTLYLWGILVATFLIHLAHVWILTGSVTGGGLIEVLLFRMNRDSSLMADMVGFSWGKYLLQQIRWFIAFFTKPTLFASFGWTILFLYQGYKKKVSKESAFVALVLGIALLYPLIFSNAVFIHDYLNIYFLPFVSVSAVLFIVFVLSRFTSRTLSKAAILFCFTVLVGLSAKNFYLALQQSENARVGYELGVKLHSLTKEDESTVVFASQFGNFYSRFVDYYSERNVQYREDSLEELQKNLPTMAGKYKYMVVVPSHFQDNRVITYLQSSYPSWEDGGFIFYKLY